MSFSCTVRPFGSKQENSKCFSNSRSTLSWPPRVSAGAGRPGRPGGRPPGSGRWIQVQLDHVPKPSTVWVSELRWPEHHGRYLVALMEDLPAGFVIDDDRPHRGGVPRRPKRRRQYPVDVDPQAVSAPTKYARPGYVGWDARTGIARTPARERPSGAMGRQAAGSRDRGNDRDGTHRAGETDGAGACPTAPLGKLRERGSAGDNAAMTSHQPAPSRCRGVPR